jgi:hypothetical protein
LTSNSRLLAIDTKDKSRTSTSIGGFIIQYRHSKRF